MRKPLTLALTILTLAGSGMAGLRAQAAQAAAPSTFAGTPASFADLAEVLLPAVVNISSTQKMDKYQGGANNGMPPGMEELFPQFPPGSPFEDMFREFFGDQGGGPMQNIPQSSLGSGFIIDAQNGYVITNNHVIRDADEVRVILHDDTSLEAEIIGRDEKTDIAVLKVKTDRKLMSVRFGDSDRMRVGDWIMAIGNPFGLGGTVTAGIISARQRNINSGPYDDYIQTDASINRGNSGGPMFNLSGEVIGINTAIYSPTGGSVGIGFAIPSSLDKPVVDQIVKYGRTRRGWLGVRIQTVTDEIAQSLGLEKARGALIASVTKDGPAEKAGLQAGDIILSFNGKEINQMRSLPRVVAESDIGEKAELVIWRDGKTRKATVSVGELEIAEDEGIVDAENQQAEEPAKGETIDKLGFSVAPLTDNTRKQFGIDSSIKGVVITNVAQDSEAALKGLSTGDVIAEMNQKAVRTPQDIITLTESAAKSQRGTVLMLIYREGYVRFLALKIAPDKPPDNAPDEKHGDGDGNGNGKTETPIEPTAPPAEPVAPEATASP